MIMSLLMYSNRFLHRLDYIGDVNLVWKVHIRPSLNRLWKQRLRSSLVWALVYPPDGLYSTQRCWGHYSTVCTEFLTIIRSMYLLSWPNQIDNLSGGHVKLLGCLPAAVMKYRCRRFMLTLYVTVQTQLVFVLVYTENNLLTNSHFLYTFQRSMNRKWSHCYPFNLLPCLP